MLNLGSGVGDPFICGIIACGQEMVVQLTEREKRHPESGDIVRPPCQPLSFAFSEQNGFRGLPLATNPGIARNGI
ncbi:MAG: hypothetical protein DRP71_02335 [Verrucomicrobia bacterium]|nr:MAG: hypothetical protein DRP71_02335 [Verrucomicrobiota bacterium]